MPSLAKELGKLLASFPKTCTIGTCLGSGGREKKKRKSPNYNDEKLLLKRETSTKQNTKSTTKTLADSLIRGLKDLIS